MKRLFLALALACSACNTMGGPLAPPAPLANTTIDERALILSLKTFDVCLTLIDKLGTAGVIKQGSPTALKIANAIDAVVAGYKLARAAQKAGNSTDYLSAINNLQNLVEQLQRTVV